ncbi:uncharacterized protein LOC130825417 [Amaranthus tricolor]|uniref:uncharacterized protein LOC130825417 n=1 Tax=Amaranthus tricolor TaxID=29722 RepID=UPI002588FE66|nr:uncharacterized protein LOC130825417 [Amaranthus tricolor]
MMESVKPAQVRKAKKKQVKDELDRIKQAEKKRRRLEKALATSAAIRLELEKKKQLKQEEQQRLDEEGAAIAKAVALHVLLGEDSDNTPTIVLNKEEEFNTWHDASSFGLLMDKSALASRQSLKKCSFESVGWFPLVGQECEWKHFGEIHQPFSSLPQPCFNGGSWSHDDFSVGFVAAQAASSLRIGEDAHGDRVFFNRY